MTHYIKWLAAYCAVLASHKFKQAQSRQFTMTNLADCVCQPIKSPTRLNCTINPNFIRNIYAGPVINQSPFPDRRDCYFQTESTLIPNSEVPVSDYLSGQCNEDDMNNTHYITLSSHNDNNTARTTEINTDQFGKFDSRLSIITVSSPFANMSVAVPSGNVTYDPATENCEVKLTH